MYLYNIPVLSFSHPPEILLFLTAHVVLVANYNNHLGIDCKFDT